MLGNQLLKSHPGLRYLQPHAWLSQLYFYRVQGLPKLYNSGFLSRLCCRMAQLCKSLLEGTQDAEQDELADTLKPVSPTCSCCQASAVLSAWSTFPWLSPWLSPSHPQVSVPMPPLSYVTLCTAWFISLKALSTICNDLAYLFIYCLSPQLVHKPHQEGWYVLAD